MNPIADIGEFSNDNYLHFYIELGLSAVLLILFFIAKSITTRLIRRQAQRNSDSKARMKYVIKLSNLGLTLILITLLALVWEISFKGLAIYFASFFTVVGVAFFASWSILSNVTAYAIIFFNLPFRIGSQIKILDGNDTVEGKVDDITLFFIKIKLPSGDIVTYPNNVAIQKPIMEIRNTDQKPDKTK